MTWSFVVARYLWVLCATAYPPAPFLSQNAEHTFCWTQFGEGFGEVPAKDKDVSSPRLGTWSSVTSNVASTTATHCSCASQAHHRPAKWILRHSSMHRWRSRGELRMADRQNLWPSSNPLSSPRTTSSITTSVSHNNCYPSFKIASRLSVSSKTSMVYTVYAVFKNSPGGRWMLDLPSCSCKRTNGFVLARLGSCISSGLYSIVSNLNLSFSKNIASILS